MNAMEAFLITSSLVLGLMMTREVLSSQLVRVEVSDRHGQVSKLSSPLKSPQRQARYRIARTC